MFSVTNTSRLLAVVLILSFSQSLVANGSKRVYLRTPPSFAHGDYLKALFIEAYGQMGYRVEYLDVPGVREADLTVASELSGMLARDPIIEKSYPALIRVDVPLFSYDLLLIGDRRQCHYCDYNQIKDVVYPRGGKIYEEILSTFPDTIDKTAVSGGKSVEKLLIKQRVDAALVSNFGLSESLYSNPHFITKIIETRYDYHYLAPQYADLLEPLTRVLTKMEQNGELKALKQQFGIKETAPVEFDLPNKVFAVTGTWKDYAEPDNKGTYWQILEKVFQGHSNLTTNSSTWMRSVRLFEMGKADILVGAYLNDPQGYPSSTYHIDYEYEVIAVAKTEKDLSDFMAGNKAFRVCAPEAYDIVLSELNPVNKLHNSSVASCIDKFNNSEIDVLLQYPYNLEPLMARLPWQTFYKPAPLFLMFQNTKSGQALKALFDRRIAELAREGQIKALFPTTKDYRRAKITEH